MKLTKRKLKTEFKSKLTHRFSKAAGRAHPRAVPGRPALLRGPLLEPDQAAVLEFCLLFVHVLVSGLKTVAARFGASSTRPWRRRGG